MWEITLAASQGGRYLLGGDARRGETGAAFNPALKLLQQHRISPFLHSQGTRCPQQLQTLRGGGKSLRKMCYFETAVPQRRFLPSSPSSFPAPQRTCCSNREFSAPLGSLVSFTPDTSREKKTQNTAVSGQCRFSKCPYAFLSHQYCWGETKNKCREVLHVSELSQNAFSPPLPPYFAQNQCIFSKAANKLYQPLWLCSSVCTLGNGDSPPIYFLFTSSFSPHCSLPPSL